MDVNWVSAWLGKADALEALGDRHSAIRVLRRALDVDALTLDTRAAVVERLDALARREDQARTGVVHATIFVCARCERAFDDDSATCARCGSGGEVATRCWRCQRAVALDGGGCSTCRADPLALAVDQGRAAAVRGERLLELGKFADALSIFDGLVRLFPKAAGGWMGRAWALEGLGRDDEATESKRRAYEAAPESLAVQRAVSQWLRGTPAATPPATAPPAPHDARAALTQGLARGRRPSERITSPMERERRFRERLGPLFHQMERSLFHMSARSDAVDASRADELRASAVQPEAVVAPSSEPIADLLASADRLAEAGQLDSALVHVERALAVDVATPGGTERWRRWGAIAREAALTHAALLPGDAGHSDSLRRELCEVARALESSHADAAATVAWALVGDERPRLRLLAAPHVCEALIERLASACNGALAGGDSGTSSPRALRIVAELVRSGRRRAALREARTVLARGEEPHVAEIAALVLALAVRGPRVDLWRDRDGSRDASVDPDPANDGPVARVLASDRVRLALGERVTLGRLGASIRVNGRGVAPVHVSLERDRSGAALLDDAGTAIGTTLAGARIAAALPIGDGLRVELGGRVPLHAAALERGRDLSPIALEVGGEVYLIPLGELAIGAAGEITHVPESARWTIWMEPVPDPDPASNELPHSQLAPWAMLRAPAGSRPQVCGALAHEAVELCFGDVFKPAPGARPLLAIRPPVDATGP
jgi:tetratricopeptide (TPR) repeat protein